MQYFIIISFLLNLLSYLLIMKFYRLIIFSMILYQSLVIIITSTFIESPVMFICLLLHDLHDDVSIIQYRFILHH